MNYVLPISTNIERRVGFPSSVEEELPMTMQAGMVGTDGILIASDTQWTNSPMLTDRSWAGGRHGFNSPKIIINHERGMAISCARDMETARHVAREISGLKEEGLNRPTEAIEEIIARTLPAAVEQKKEAHCLIALTRPAPQLLLFQFGTLNGKWGPICQKMETKGIAGDTLNAAIFWVERYYKSRPIEQLVPLAAYLIISASKLNTAMISGLEVVLCTSTSIRRISDDSIHELKQKANEWDRRISDMFLDHRQQFTYAPDGSVNPAI